MSDYVHVIISTASGQCCAALFSVHEGLVSKDTKMLKKNETTFESRFRATGEPVLSFRHRCSVLTLNMLNTLLSGISLCSWAVELYCRRYKGI